MTACTSPGCTRTPLTNHTTCARHTPPPTNTGTTDSPADPDVWTITPTTLTGNPTIPRTHTRTYARFWIPIIGPTSTLAYLTLHDLGPEPSVINPAELASDLGLGRKHDRLNHAIARLERFRLARRTPTGLDYAQALPLLSPRQLERTRPGLAAQETAYRETLIATGVLTIEGT